MKRTFFSLGLLSLMLYSFDTQDNLVKSNKDSDWLQNVDLDTFEVLQEVGLWRTGDKTFWVKSKKPIKSIRINNFPHRYRVRKINSKHFEVRCVNLQRYFDNTDNIEIIVKS